MLDIGERDFLFASLSGEPGLEAPLPLPRPLPIPGPWFWNIWVFGRCFLVGENESFCPKELLPDLSIDAYSCIFAACAIE